jgi:hypothetical protein
VLSQDFELGWLAGILEGEGCFWIHQKSSTQRYPKVTITMTDEDVVANVARLLGSSVTPQKARGNRKPTYKTQLTGKRAVQAMKLVRPYMHGRRQEKIDEILGEFSPSTPSSPAHLSISES